MALFSRRNRYTTPNTAATRQDIREEPRQTDVFGEYAGTAAPQTLYERSVGSRIGQVIYTLTGLLVALIGLRFVMLLAGANPLNGVVEFLYGFTYPFVAPFQSIFGSTSPDTGIVAQSVFEPGALIAMAAYALVGWFLARLFTSASNRV